MSVTMINPVHPTPQAEQAWDRALDEALARPKRRTLAQPVVKTVAKFAPRFATVLAALLLSACAAPAFKQPAVSTPVAFKEAQVAAPAAVQSAADGSTWKVAQPAEAQPRGEWWKADAAQALSSRAASTVAKRGANFATVFTTGCASGRRGCRARASSSARSQACSA